MNSPEKPHRTDLVGILMLTVVFGLLLLAYLAFPWALRQMSYQYCVASGQTTGCYQ